jgi:predicted Zn-dependent protease
MKHEIGVHMMENAICQHTLPYYHSSIRSKEGFWQTSVWWQRRILCTHGRATTTEEEEASVEAVAKETGSSGRGNQRSTERRGLREFWDESKRTRGGLLFIGSKISATVLN